VQRENVNVEVVIRWWWIHHHHHRVLYFSVTMTMPLPLARCEAQLRRNHRPRLRDGRARAGGMIPMSASGLIFPLERAAVVGAAGIGILILVIISAG
jgi:hypothetical protein